VTTILFFDRARGGDDGAWAVLDPFFGAGDMFAGPVRERGP